MTFFALLDLPEAMPRSRRSPGPNVHRERRFLPEHVDLGLRLTVGEDVVQKPFLPSSQGAGHFPESAGAFTEPSLKAYYPSQNGGPGSAYAVLYTANKVNVLTLRVPMQFRN